MSTYVFVHHTIKDAETAFARGERLLAGTGAPAGVRVLQFCPSRDRSQVMCIWEADGVDAVRDYVDSTLGDASDNAYFEIDGTVALGLPQPVGTA
jgi:hypothetical protein